LQFDDANSAANPHAMKQNDSTATDLAPGVALVTLLLRERAE